MWLVKAKLVSAALIVIGQNVTTVRKYFRTHDDAWSWRLCADRIRSCSQPAKTQSQYVTDRVVTQRSIIVPMYVKPPRELRLYPPKQEPTGEPEVVETSVLHEAVAAVQGVIAASSLSTDTVARFWSDDDRPSPDQIREAAAWLEALADACTVPSRGFPHPS